MKASGTSAFRYLLTIPGRRPRHTPDLVEGSDIVKSCPLVNERLSTIRSSVNHTTAEDDYRKYHKPATRSECSEAGPVCWPPTSAIAKLLTWPEAGALESTRHRALSQRASSGGVAAVAPTNRQAFDLRACLRSIRMMHVTRSN